MLLILSTVGLFLVLVIIYSIRYSPRTWLGFLIATLLSGVGVAGAFNLLRDKVTTKEQILLLYQVTAAVSAMLYGLLWGQRAAAGSADAAKKKGKPFVLPLVGGRQLIFRNPFDNFLIYGGAGSGKTKSIGKNLLINYIREGWAGFLYDYKEGDYTKTAFDLVERHQYPHRVVHANFINLSCTHRFNIVKPSVIKDEGFFSQLMGDIIAAYMADSKQDEWYMGALGLFRGVGLRFFLDYPDKCTVPHIVNFIVHSDADRLRDFLQRRPESRAAAAAYLQAEGSEKTQASIRNSVSNYISPLALDKRVQYVLSGDDFDFNLIDPADPKLLLVANAFQLDTLLGPINALMLSVAMRSFTMENRVPFFVMLDEATTFKIPHFERLLSVLREYLCSFVILTQSPAKIEKLYGQLDLRSIEANCGNKFFGRSLDLIGAESSSKQFARPENKKITRTTGRNSHSSSRSRSVSTIKEQRYEPDYFMQLKPGEFVGRAQNANQTEFHVNFKLYEPGAGENIPIFRPVIDGDIERNYQRIVAEVMDLT